MFICCPGRADPRAFSQSQITFLSFVFRICRTRKKNIFSHFSFLRRARPHSRYKKSSNKNARNMLSSGTCYQSSFSTSSLSSKAPQMHRRCCSRRVARHLPATASFGCGTANAVPAVGAQPSRRVSCTSKSSWRSPTAAMVN